jgi:hypothetical protein
LDWERPEIKVLLKITKQFVRKYTGNGSIMLSGRYNIDFRVKDVITKGQAYKYISVAVSSSCEKLKMAV